VSPAPADPEDAGAAASVPTDGAAGSSAGEPLRLDGEDALLFDLADAVVGLARLLQVADVQSAGVVSLTGTEIAVMRWVHRHPGTTSGETARATGLHRSNMSAALRGLVSKGLVQREGDPEDSRLVHLRLTEVAEEDSRRIRLHWAEVLRDRLPALDDEDRAALERSVDLLTSWEGVGPR
jgi:DNA-binding MarR family transcriptional regulator